MTNKHSDASIAPPVDSTRSFSCRMCGHCCEGRGGIVVSDRDLERICRYLGMSREAFEEAYGERRGGKLHIRAGEDGRCLFFRQGRGCCVHPGKPDICRAWPFFRGNLVDEESFLLASDFCPGIVAERGHAAFVREGLEYLACEGLAGRAGADEAGALQVADIAAPLADKTGKG